MLSLMKPYSGFTTHGNPAKPVSTATCVQEGKTITHQRQQQQHSAGTG